MEDRRATAISSMLEQHPTVIYRLLSRAAWQAAQATGVFEGSEHDRRDGFIHFSTAAQLAATAAKHYARQADLVVLHVDVSKLDAPLRWEVSRGGQLFPHLYGSLAIAAVRRVDPVPLSENGVHRFETLED